MKAELEDTVWPKREWPYLEGRKKMAEAMNQLRRVVYIIVQ